MEFVFADTAEDVLQRALAPAAERPVAVPAA
jgi:hypothetical protein